MSVGYIQQSPSKSVGTNVVFVVYHFLSDHKEGSPSRRVIRMSMNYDKIIVAMQATIKHFHKELERASWMCVGRPGLHVTRPSYSELADCGCSQCDNELAMRLLLKEVKRIDDLRFEEAQRRMTPDQREWLKKLLGAKDAAQ